MSEPWYTYPTVIRWYEYGYEIETVYIISEWLVGCDAFHSPFCIGYEQVVLCLSVSFGAYGNIDAFGRSAGILYVFGPSLLGIAVVIVYLADKYIGWNDTVGH